MADIDYASEIEKIKETNPHQAINGYISKQVHEATAKAEKTSYTRGFWHGFWLALLIIFVLWIIITLG